MTELETATPPPQALASRTRTARVVGVVQETADASSLVLHLAGPPVSYRPGQFLTIRVPSDRTGSVARCYSLSSAPTTDDDLVVTVKRTAGGYASNWLCDHAVEGTTLEVLPPEGVFTPHHGDQDLLLVAAGSGITPVMSILKSALHTGTGAVVLLYANRDVASVIFADQLAGLAAQHPDRLTVVHWLESLQGLPTVAQLRTLALPHLDHDAFVCGPAPFMEAVTQALREAGVPRERLHTEVYASLAGDPFAAPTAHVADPGAAVSSVEVELDGEVHQLSWPADTTLVDLLLTHGIEAPYSCREGECGACTCLVQEGTVRMLRADALDPADVAEGYALGCQALPTSPALRIIF